jgi:menaquinone-9 beta-reductase
VQHCDLVVVGGGPGGAATAWQAASIGLRVVVLDKATFPRDKPCGDGLTPRAVQLIERMGLRDQLERFHRVDGIRFITPRRQVEAPWPHREHGLPGHGYVVPRTELDEMLLRNAQAAGADVLDGARVLGPIIEGGVVRGVRVASNRDNTEEVRAPLTVAADGMSSPVGRAAGLVPRAGRPFAVAVRAQVEAHREDDRHLEMYMTIRPDGRMVPGYGWVFEMGDGRINIGLGYCSTYRGKLNVNELMADFLTSLPPSWKLPTVADLISSGCMRGWRLPMGFTVWPPWRPGLMAVGDAAGVVKPFTGAGISKAMQSGLLAATVAADVLSSGDPGRLRDYETVLERMWGSHYQLGRGFLALIGRPAVMAGADPLVEAVLRHPPTTLFFMKLMSHLHRRRGGSVGDHILRGIHGTTRRLPIRAPGPERPRIVPARVD